MEKLTAEQQASQYVLGCGIGFQKEDEMVPIDKVNDVAYHSFIEGYEKAKEWIPVDYSLPENDKTILIEVDMNDDGGEHLITTGQFSNGRFYSDLERLNPLIKYEGVQVVNWRYID